METTPKLKYHEKVKVCTAAMQGAEEHIASAAKLAAEKEYDSLAVVLKGVSDRLRDARLRVQPVRQVLSVEDRKRRFLLKQHERHIARTLAWLKTDGIKKGAPGQRRKDGARVVFCNDPFITLEGIRISVQFVDTDAREDYCDPMQFMPDLTVPPVSPTKPPTRKPAAARKTAPAKIAASTRGRTRDRKGAVTRDQVDAP